MFHVTSGVFQEIRMKTLSGGEGSLREVVFSPASSVGSSAPWLTAFGGKMIKGVDSF